MTHSAQRTFANFKLAAFVLWQLKSRLWTLAAEDLSKAKQDDPQILGIHAAMQPVRCASVVWTSPCEWRPASVWISVANQQSRTRAIFCVDVHVQHVSKPVDIFELPPIGSSRVAIGRWPVGRRVRSYIGPNLLC
ncbi:hypothetical protein DENSPDRAFT_839175 [Dentipellis sp. KUC8613]|nr:hypothetical protein DENSPDRAFT_839175 [Dentipellis sp. KUC8613]